MKTITKKKPSRQSARQDSINILLEAMRIQLQFGLDQAERQALIKRIDVILKGNK